MDVGDETKKKKQGKKGAKKKKPNKAEIKEAEAAARELALAEAQRIRAEEEAAERARVEANKKAKALMRQAFERKGVVRGTEDEVGPFEIWRYFEGTRAALWKGRLSFVEPDAEEFEVRTGANGCGAAADGRTVLAMMIITSDGSDCGWRLKLAGAESLCAQPSTAVGG